MKNSLKYILQKLLGMRLYLFLFSNFIIYSLPFNKKEKDFLHFVKLINNDGLILDIGANIGIMTYHLSKRKPKSTILAFEPIPENLAALEKIIETKKLKNVEVLPFAIGNENQEAQMVMPCVDEVKMQGLSHVLHESITEFNEGKIYDITIKRLDDLEIIKNASQNLIAIKMDVENFEYYVLEGAIETIKKHKPLIYTELWDNENRYKCIDLLTTLNYRAYILQNDTLIAFEIAKHSSQNFFFLPKKNN